MSLKPSAKQSRPAELVNQLLSMRLVRLLIAGICALTVTLALILFMQFLIMGYDDENTGLLTRYLSIRTIFTSKGAEEIKRIERPAERPIIPETDETEDQQDVLNSLNENSLKIPSFSEPINKIEKDIQLPALGTAPLTTQEKLQQIKEAILSEDE